MISTDFHTHTTYSHGKGSVLENAQSAKQKGINAIGIADHGFSHPIFGLRRRKLQALKRDCVQATELTGVNVLMGIEANIRGLSGKTDLLPTDYEMFDVFLAGIHVVVLYEKFSDYFNLFAGNLIASRTFVKPSERLIKNTTTAYIQAIKNNPIDILTHLNFRCFSNYLDVAKCCEDYGTLIEINTKKVHLSDQAWQDIIDKTNVQFVVDSDAHSPDRVGDTALADKLFERVKFPEERILNIGQNEIPKLRLARYKEEKL